MDYLGLLVFQLHVRVMKEKRVCKEPMGQKKGFIGIFTAIAERLVFRFNACISVRRPPL